MKKFLACTFALAALFVCAITSAVAQLTPVHLQYGLSNATYVGAVASTNVSNARVVTLRQGVDHGLSIVMVGTNAATTTNMFFVFQVSQDGTNYSTYDNGYYSVIANPNGTTKVLTFTNLPTSFLNTAIYMKLTKITNNNIGGVGPGVWVTNVIVSTRY